MYVFADRGWLWFSGALNQKQNKKCWFKLFLLFKLILFLNKKFKFQIWKKFKTTFFFLLLLLLLRTVCDYNWLLYKKSVYGVLFLSWYLSEFFSVSSFAIHKHAYSFAPRIIYNLLNFQSHNSTNKADDKKDVDYFLNKK